MIATIDSFTIPAATPPAPLPLRILHVNDMHARIEPADSNFNLATPATYGIAYGGLARLATHVAAARSQAASAGQDVLVLHAGDQYQGTPWHAVYTRVGNHTPIWEMLNPIAFDAMVGAPRWRPCKGMLHPSVLLTSSCC